MPVVVNTELGSGLPQTRSFKPVQPEDVADAIVEALQTGRFEVFVPRALAPMLRLNALMPRKLAEAVGRAMKSDQVLMHPDHGARAAYEARMVDTIAPGADARRALRRARDRDRLDRWSRGEPLSSLARRTTTGARRNDGRCATGARGQALEPSQSAIRAPISAACVLLEEVAGVGDHVRDLGAERRGEPLAGLERQHRIRVGPQHQLRARVGAQRLEHPLAGLRRPASRDRSGASAGTRARRPSRPGLGNGAS